ncbi:MAG: 3,4-dihydroxy-2-butanone-4-phosphate synthase [Solirubrobacterales bacterium]|nr:3,4-dihydroxy-2-butanone-4-phosphate synthase [Solirubrobacterales bacterium]
MAESVLSGPYCSAEEAIEEFEAGRMLIVSGGRHSVNDGDLVVPARAADADRVNFMVRDGRGLVCLALTGERCDQLGLEPMAERRVPVGQADFTISIEAAEGVSTGISAADRARTIAVAIDPENGRESLVRPGHVFPLRERPGGVLARAGHVEAGLDLSRLARTGDSVVLCQILDEEGDAAGTGYLAEFAARHGIKMVRVDEVIRHLSGLAADREAPRPAEESRQLRSILGHFATGVTVVTTTDLDGAPCGTTANAFTSVSLDPPLILVCLARESHTLEMIRARGGFVANILADGQQDHSNWFARRGVRLDPALHEFEAGRLGLPVLAGTVGHLECEVERIDDGGDHEIVLGRVVSHGRHEAPDPLLFYQGSYRSLNEPRPANRI